MSAMPDFHDDPPTREDSCEKHGAYEARNLFGEMWTKCPTCADERRAAEREQEERQNRFDQQMRWKEKLIGAGIPERFRNRTLESYLADTDEQRHALHFAERYAGNFAQVLAAGRCAVFVGKPGTGKTHLAVGIGLAIMGDGYSALFTTAMRALRRIKDTWQRNSDYSERQAVESLVFPDLLILDEVGIQFGSDTEKLLLFDVLNERYERRKPTILLSNLTVNEVSDYLGERIFDRLREDDGQVVVFGWQGHRGRLASAGRDLAAGADA